MKITTKDLFMLNNIQLTSLNPQAPRVFPNSNPRQWAATDYLEITNHVIRNALLEYGEISAVLVELKLPNWIDVHNDKLIIKFLLTFQSMIDEEMLNKNAYDCRSMGDDKLICKPRFIWSRNSSVDGKALNYSLMIIFNKKAFAFTNQKEIWVMFFGIESAWAIALELNVEGGIGGNPLVQKFERFEYEINKVGSFPHYNEQEFNRLLFAASRLYQLKNHNNVIQLYSSGI